MRDFPSWFRVPVGDWTDTFVDMILVDFSAVFDGITTVMLWPLLRLEWFFLWLPWWVLIPAAAWIAWRVSRRRTFVLMVTALLLSIGALGLWKMAMSTLAILGVATLISIVIGIPTGIVMARYDRFRRLMGPLLDAMQTMPSFVYLIPVMMLFGLGPVPAVIATLVYATPPLIRLTDLGIREVDSDIVEAANAFGPTPLQILFGVQLPLARPTIMAGINQTTMMALAMVVIASMIGARGMGQQVLMSIQRVEIGRGFEAGLGIVFLAVVIDRVTQAASRSRTSPGA